MRDAVRKRLPNGIKQSGYERCRQCKGKCCKANSCAYLPEDIFKNQDEDYLKKTINKMIKKKRAMINSVLVLDEDKKDGFYISLFLSAPEKINTNGVNVGIIRSGCMLLTIRGCKLKEKDRPAQGLLLVPDDDYLLRCIEYFDLERDLIGQWKPYQKVLSEIVVERTGKDKHALLNDALYKKCYYSLYDKEIKIAYPQYLFESIMDKYERGVRTFSIHDKMALDTLFYIGFYQKKLPDVLFDKFQKIVWNMKVKQ